MSVPRGTLVGMDPLTDTERLALRIAGRSYRWEGHRDDAIRAETGLPITRFWQQVNALLDDPAAAAAAPSVVARLRHRR